MGVVVVDVVGRIELVEVDAGADFVQRLEEEEEEELELEMLSALVLERMEWSHLA